MRFESAPQPEGPSDNELEQNALAEHQRKLQELNRESRAIEDRLYSERLDSSTKNALEARLKEVGNELTQTATLAERGHIGALYRQERLLQGQLSDLNFHAQERGLTPEAYHEMVAEEMARIHEELFGKPDTHEAGIDQSQA
jgi:hypothetical protein